MGFITNIYYLSHSQNRGIPTKLQFNRETKTNINQLVGSQPIFRQAHFVVVSELTTTHLGLSANDKPHSIT